MINSDSSSEKSVAPNPRLLAVLSVYDYGVTSRGHSYEYINVLQPLQDVFGESAVDVYDFFSACKSKGKKAMNAELSALVHQTKPDIVLFCLFEDEFEPGMVAELQHHTTTVAYFFDDPWRREYVAFWRNKFHFFTTPDYYMLQRYLLSGISNVIYSPFGFNTKVYHKLSVNTKFDVSFVGGYSSYREWIINYLKKKGISVAVFGRNWGNHGSFVTQTGMVEIFNQSKINLNLTNGISFDAGYLLSSLKSPGAMKHILLNRKNKEQVKGRHYEINACGGFQLSYYVPGLNTVYEIDKEIAVFEDPRQLPEQIEFFLKHDSLRNEIAQAGYKRSVVEHSAQAYLERTIRFALSKKIV